MRDLCAGLSLHLCVSVSFYMCACMCVRACMRVRACVRVLPRHIARVEATEQVDLESTAVYDHATADLGSA